MDPRTDGLEYLNVLNPECHILWICGVAGAGKSSIALSVANALRKTDSLGSLYRFQRANQTTLNPTNLFSTIARHFGERDVFWEQNLVNIIRASDKYTQKSLSPTEQFDKFLVALLNRSRKQLAIQPTVIIIDAFDESENIDERGETLRILMRRAHELPAGVRLLVTSRFELDVQKELESQMHMVCLLKMEDIPERNTRDDIYAYVHDVLKDVYGLSLTPDIIKQFTELALAAEQSFQWASAACSFIKTGVDKDASKSPRTRLEEVLRHRRGLDGLYHMILDENFGSSAFGPEDPLPPYQVILGSLVCSREPLSLRSLVGLCAAPGLGADEYEYQRQARAIASLVTGTHDLLTPLVPLHTSFTDFLSDSARSKVYFVDAPSFQKRLAMDCLHVMHSNLCFNICKIPTSFRPNDEIENIEELIKANISSALSYACRQWPYHLSQLPNWAESPSFSNSVTALLEGHFLEWLEVMSLTRTSTLEMLTSLAATLKVNCLPVFDIIHIL